MMILRVICAALIFGLAGCASYTPAPVADGRLAGARSPASAEKLYTVKKGDTLKSIARVHGVDYRELAAWNNIENINRIRLGQQLRVSAPAAAAVSAAPAAEGTEVRPIAGGGAVVARSLEDGNAAVPPAPTLSPALPANSETLKRTPKGGKLPYSEENLARLKAEEAGPVALAPTPAVPTVTAAAPPEKPAVPAGAPEIEWAWPAPGKLIGSFSEAAAGGQEVLKGIDIAGKVGDPVHAAAAGKVIYVGVFPKHGNLVVLLHGGGYSSVYAHNSRMLVKEGQMVTRGQKIAELGDSDADRPKLHFELRQQGKPVDPLKFLPAR